ncbi:alpha/beta hydrolase [Paraburkholderia sp. RL17-337-BIB-A]|uniref:alpha/beta hydrolase n=1 Tax=Paraburkholderia sp. RL17-337-BIB-A TaxID=3031636 RepID=UPI0038BD07C7
MKTISAKTTLIIFAAALAGCGGGGEDDLTPQQKRASAPEPRFEHNPKIASALKPYFEQQVGWLPCDKSGLPAAYGKVAESPRFRCADLRAPMDWGDPAKGEITIAVTRLAVKDPARRIGSLLFNPGGPGGDGRLANLTFYRQLAGVDATVSERHLLDAYDLIGFSPRGMGSSTQLTCGSTQRLSTVWWGSDVSASTVDALLRNAELKSKACQNNPLTPYINTGQIARDMDLIRAISGDAKLNYMGHSYGTWLGAWYAGLFPERTGRMVLSANLDFSARTMAEAGTLQQPPAIQRIADEIIGPYAARHDAHFNLGSNPAATRQLFAALPPRLQAAASSALDQSRVFALSGYIDEGASVFVAAKGVQQILEQNPGSTKDQVLALARHHAFSRHRLANQMALQIATKTVIPNYFEAAQPSPFKDDPLHMTTEEAVDLAVMCNDTPAFSTSRQLWIDKHREYAQRYPLGSGTLGGSVLNFSCLFWKPPQPAVLKPTIDEVARAPSILMIQAQFDGYTAAEGALRMFDRLPNASLLYIKGEHSHVDYPHGNPCVDEPVTRYLLTGTLPPRRVDCEDSRKLWLDAGNELEPA